MNTSYLPISADHRFYRPAALRWLGVAAFALLAGCTGPNAGVGIGSGGDDDLTNAIGSSGSDYVILDIGSGALVPTQSVPDLAANAAYRTSQMVFKRVHGSGDDYLLGVFEVTQAQWAAIAGIPAGGVPPWDPTIIDPAIVGAAAVGGSKPAFNLSYSAIEQAIDGYNAGRTAHLEVPTAAQWQYACSAGSTGAWSWGDDSSYTTLFENAVVYESQGDTIGTRGPQSVGGRRANAFGFFDMHGNVWEWSSPGTNIHGGSWHDSYRQARTANQPGFLDAGIVDLTTHALIGVRMKLQL